MQKIHAVNNIEQTYERNFHEAAAKTYGQISLSLGAVAMRFARVERVPRYVDSRRESDVEHSFMLGLVAPELAAAIELSLDLGLIAQYANVHDLIELKTGDVATFLLSEDEMLQKELIEQAALRDLARELPPHTASLLLRYESQTEPEARFVRAVDKLLPVVVDIIGDGDRVMREDYDISSLAILQKSHHLLHERLTAKFGTEFPELMLAHRLLTELFEQKFSAA